MNIENINIDEYKYFGNENLGEAGQFGAWAAAEESHRWNDGPEVGFLIATTIPVAALTLVVTGTPFITNGCPFQEITTFGNGFRLGYWRLAESQLCELRLQIEPEQWFRRGSKAVMKVVWSLPNSKRPSDLGLGADGRSLGFCFHSIGLLAKA